MGVTTVGGVRVDLAELSAAERPLFGAGDWPHARRGVRVAQVRPGFHGLVTDEAIPAGGVVFARAGVSAGCELGSHADMRAWSDEHAQLWLKYAWLLDQKRFLAPSQAERVPLDPRNYINHSLEPLLPPLVAVRDVEAGEALCTDYACLDSYVDHWDPTHAEASSDNTTITIDVCLCGAKGCRKWIRQYDYRQPSLRAAYAGHFLPYIARQLEREDALAAAGLPLGGSGPPSDVLSNPALLRAFYEDAAARDTSDLFNARALERYKRRLSGTSDQPHAVAP